MLERQAERRLITALFIDIVGSTELQSGMGPERMKRALDQAFVDIHGLITDEGGTVEKFIGDAVFAIFGAPTAHEDDPLRALRAAEACVRWAAAGTERTVPFAVRIGVETGDALVDVHGTGVEHQQMAVGACVNTAARLQQVAESGTVLVGPTCRGAVDGAGTFEALGERDLKGLGRIAVHRLVRIAGAAERAHLPFVGRSDEIEMLGLAHRRARSGRSVLALVSGPPGQGKTRTVEEFLSRSAGGPAVLTARCRPGGEVGALNVLRQLLIADVGDDGLRRVQARVAELFADTLEADRIARSVAHSAGIAASEELAALGADERHDEIADAWQRYLAAIGRERGIVVWVEDLHWAEPELVRLIDRLTAGGKAPLLVIATARPEFAEQVGLRPSGDRMFIELHALGEPEAQELARTAGAGDAATAARGEGNPLFIIELVRGGETAGALPLTLQGAIGARLDDLPVADRELLQRAAIAGETFSARDAALLSAREVGDVGAVLDRLADRQYLQRLRGRYRYSHALVHDVCYQRLPVAERMRLHAAFAREGPGPEEFEALAHHWWEALRPPDAEWVWEGHAELAGMRREAFRASLEAGRRHAGRFAHAAAAALYERALAFAAAPLDRAVIERAVADGYRSQIACDDAWGHYLRAREAYREAGSVPADLYADMLQVPVRLPGGFKQPPDDAVIHELLDEGEAAARATGDVLSLAAILFDRAGLRFRAEGIVEDTELIDEAYELLQRSEFPSGSADLLVGLIELRAFGMQDPAAARPIHDRLEEMIHAGARLRDEDSYWRVGVFMPVDTGRLDLARAAADAYIVASERRGPHLLSHALGARADVASLAGEWPLLLDLAARCRTLLREHSSTHFCIGGVGGTLRNAACLLALRGRRDEAAELIRLAEGTTDVRRHGPAFILAYALLGRSGDVDRVRERGRTSQPGQTAIAMTIMERWNEALAVAERLAAWGRRGGAPQGALAAAVREEAAAASGGPPPRHAALRELGLHGWSEILRFRPARDA